MFQIRICHEAWQSYAGLVVRTEPTFAAATRYLDLLSETDMREMGVVNDCNPAPNEVFITRQDDPALRPEADSGGYVVIAARHFDL